MIGYTHIVTALTYGKSDRSPPPVTNNARIIGLGRYPEKNLLFFFGVVVGVILMKTEKYDVT